MGFYIFTAIFVMSTGMLAHMSNSNIGAYEYDATRTKYKNHYGIFYYVMFAYLVFVSGFRYGVGSDFYGYYKPRITNKKDLIESFKSLDEPAMKLFKNIARTIWDNPQTLILFSSLVCLMCVFHGIKNFDKNQLTLMVLLYMFIGGWLFSFNGVRQALAVSIVFAFSSIYAYGRGVSNYIKILLIIFIAFMFHKSALMMLPLIFISRRKIDYKQIILIAISAIVIPYFFDNLFDFMGTNTTDEMALEYIERKINPIRIVVAIAPLTLMIFVKNKQQFFEDNKFIINMTLFNALLYFVTANSAYLNRFTKFTIIYLSIYIPITLRSIENKQTRNIITVITLILYFAYWLYEIYNGGSYLPYELGFKYM